MNMSIHAGNPGERRHGAARWSAVTAPPGKLIYNVMNRITIMYAN